MLRHWLFVAFGALSLALSAAACTTHQAGESDRYGRALTEPTPRPGQDVSPRGTGSD